jgi:hypothetical protein
MLDIIKKKREAIRREKIRKYIELRKLQIKDACIVSFN